MILLRGLVKLVLVAMAAGGVGLLLGLGVSKLTGSSDSQTPGGAASSTAPASTGRAAATYPRQPPPQGALGQVRVRVLAAILHPAATPAGRQRQRARLTVRILARNEGKLAVSPARPALVLAGARVETDPRADGPGTRLGLIAGAGTADVRLQFELAGAPTTQLTKERTVRIIVAGRLLRVPVTLGAPVGLKPGR